MKRTGFSLAAVRVIAHCTIFILIIAALMEMYWTVTGIISDTGKGNRALLPGALAAVLIPSVAMLFWGLKAIIAQLRFAFEAVNGKYRVLNWARNSG
jgi:hypothetical protein